jgi:putative transcriptional regulator
MKSSDMVWVDHEPGDPPVETDTDWNAVDALTEDQIHAAALADPDSHPIPLGSDEELAKQGLIHVPNVKKLRERLGLTQEAFATTYRIPVGTLRDWEQRRKTLPPAPISPSSPATRKRWQECWAKPHNLFCSSVAVFSDLTFSHTLRTNTPRSILTMFSCREGVKV